jgi:uncharacterized membrane protein YagU involved in acid resistance
MKVLVLAAYRPSYGHGYSYSHVHSYGGGWSDWIAHMVLSSVIHAVIYRFVFQLMHRMTLGEAALLVVVVVPGLIVWARSRDQRRW